MAEKNFEEIDRPEDYQYIWRYFPSLERIREFLSGTIHLSPLSAFKDSYEAISPLLFHLIQLGDNAMVMNSREPNSNSFFRIPMLEDLKFHYSIARLRDLWEIPDGIKFQEVLTETIQRIPEIITAHQKLQERIFASCWFITTSLQEEYLMWQSYSKPGGAAIRMNFKEFKRIVDYAGRYPENDHLFNPDFIKYQKMGFIKYPEYLDQEWLNMVKSGTPLSFFKHPSYQREKEFRLCIETKEGVDFAGRNKLYFFNVGLSDAFHVILHPSSSVTEYERMTALLKDLRLSGKVFYSDLKLRRTL